MGMLPVTCLEINGGCLFFSPGRSSLPMDITSALFCTEYYNGCSSSQKYPWIIALFMYMANSISSDLIVGRE